MASVEWSGRNGSVRVDYTETTSGNNSIITVTNVYVKSSNWYGQQFYADGVVKVNGTIVLSMTNNITYSAWVPYTGVYYEIDNSSGTAVTVPHNSDGTGSAQIYLGPRGGTGYNDFNVFGEGGRGNIEITASSRSITLTNIPKISSVSTSASGTLGSSLSIAISRASTAFTHTLSYSYGSSSGTIATGVGSSYLWTPSISLASQVPNATSATCTITCTTYYNGASVGTSTTTTTLIVPASVAPSISSVTISPVNDNPAIAAWNVYVQGYTKLQVVTNASSQYGATIAEYNVIFNGTSIGKSANVVSDPLPISGTIPIIVNIKDSRGRTASYTSSISIYEYSPPQINAVEIFRCNADGVANSNGTYISIKGTQSYSSVNGKNSCNMAYRYKAATEDVYGSTVAYTSGTAVIFGGGNISTSHSYSVQLLAGDMVNPLSSSPTIVQVAIPSQLFTLHCKDGGLGVAIGKASEYNNCFEVADNWDVRIGAGKLMVGGTKFQLVFHNVTTGAFSANSTYSSFPYRAAVPLTGVTQTMIPEVILGVTEATSGSYAPVAETYNGGVYIYSNNTGSITIPTIICWGGGA